MDKKQKNILISIAIVLAMAILSWLLFFKPETSTNIKKLPDDIIKLNNDYIKKSLSFAPELSTLKGRKDKFGKNAYTASQVNKYYREEACKEIRPFYTSTLTLTPCQDLAISTYYKSNIFSRIPEKIDIVKFAHNDKNTYDVWSQLNLNVFYTEGSSGSPGDKVYNQLFRYSEPIKIHIKFEHNNGEWKISNRKEIVAMLGDRIGDADASEGSILMPDLSRSPEIIDREEIQ